MFVVITDLHETGSLVSVDHAKLMLRRLGNPEFVVYTGDILYHSYEYDTRWAEDVCDHAIDAASAVVSLIGYPFMFTLGNHDVPRHSCRPKLADALQAHPLHIGACLPGRATCIHPTLPLATIDAALRGCRGDMASLGCPTERDVAWIGSHAADGIIFTHYPPPAVLNRRVIGFVGEAPNCWRQPKSAVLPPHSVHAFGHDHNNMFYSADGLLVALYKSGVPSYGPSFSDGPGLTAFDAAFVPTFYRGNGAVWPFAELPHAKVGPRCVKVVPGLMDSNLFLLIVALCLVLLASLGFGAIEYLERSKRKRVNTYLEANDTIDETPV